jgi:hypothetical protein
MNLSFDICKTFSWLNNEQAAADSANFMANVKFDGIDEDLTAPGTPWIYYGVGPLVCIMLSHKLTLQQ